LLRKASKLRNLQQWNSIDSLMIFAPLTFKEQLNKSLPVLFLLVIRRIMLKNPHISDFKQALNF